MTVGVVDLKKWFYFFFKLLKLHYPKYPVAHDAFTINDDGHRQYLPQTKEPSDFLCPKENRVVDCKTLRQASHCALLVLLDGDTDDLQSLALILFLQFNQFWNLYAARHTPSRPKIKQHHFTFVITEAHHSATYIFERECWHPLRLTGSCLRISRN